ncbi:MAG: UDP-N-acetylmuramoyl-L-alanine--D-glutamate ligase [Sphingomonas sp.]|uniref:UDP-N-acetylmuramoylalanine--D-glutamate ligase n=1 Tax=Sphingomonas adhaesiva TaxID=28212 RepID=A0A2A4I8W7_9SPHN|nr:MULTISPECIES: UDP-N-acetylmuramoyl-L-alanine--D-glutamate ligase [Sphingomonas]PCG14949.1 UDP-N-acetylmuramoyl-L-alanine--D-glutamate ligase [Sphingomonas adhaesiva]PZU81352.1 MAG: UDP-N-acetylmuramoyl-L-alanine--D-glutamate ligase [Sphingomonas sp.]
MIVARAFAGKHYAVLGLARSGAAAVRALLAGGARVTAWDNDVVKCEALLDEVGCEALAIADLEAIDLGDVNALVVSPGVPLNRHPLAAKARAAGVPIIGDIELFAEGRADLPAHKVVGITGTNGKSTTTALVHHILDTAGIPARMGGNIGLPILAQEPLPEGGVYVLELSSYQIDLTQTLDCDVAVLLNVTPDHLDRYDGFEGYAASKARLFAMQSPAHLAVVDYEAEAELGVLDGAPAGLNVRFIDGVPLPGDQARWPSLQGPHNEQNAKAAVAVAEALGVPAETIERALESFTGLPHRMERIATLNGVAWINDSKATNPESAAPALAAFPRIHWIVGGKAKGDDLDACAPYFDHVVRAYTIGDSGARFAAVLRGHMPVAEVETLDRAVKLAAQEAERGDVVLLSPAAASFDQFTDFEHRGQVFRALVEQMA